MKKTQKSRLEKAGWKVSSAAAFLDLTPEEQAFIELKVALAESLRKRRLRRHLTQAALARILRSSQSRVAKMEAADRTVSVELLLRALVTLGAKPRDIAKVLQHSGVAA